MLENSADRQDRFIIYRRRVFDTAFRRTCMNYGIIADIDGNMSAVANDIAGLHVRDTVSDAAHCCGGMWKSYAECRIYRHNKSGTIRTVCQACTAVHIRIADKLTCVVRYCISG